MDLIQVCIYSAANFEISVFSISLTDATSNESNLSVGPRYLRMETNAFHSSEMSLGSEDLVQCSSSIINKESLSSVVDEKQASENPKNTISSSTVDNEEKGSKLNCLLRFI